MYEKITKEMLAFIDRSVTAFHAVRELSDELLASGYTELFEGERWKLKKGGRYFVVRNLSSLIAFRIPEKTPKSCMIGAAHTDSPVFQIKASPEMETDGAYVRLNVERYGGMLMHPWFDRPLSVAGRLIVKEGAGKLVSRLVNIDRDLLMIPSLAIHMDRDANKGHELNVQKELLPVLGEAGEHVRLAGLLAEVAGVSKEQIVSDDLYLYPRTKGTFWGASNEYIASPRLDDLMCVYPLFRGFVDSEEKASSSMPMLALFDNEEVGSKTRQGADATFLSDVLERISGALSMDADAYRAFLSGSFLLSADNAHALHPNHEEKADPVNRPKMNGGIVLKHNANRKYTTDAVSAAVVRELAAAAKVPVQDYTNRSDIAGGSTLGNLSVGHVSVMTADIGLAQLAMHSPCESAGARDAAYLAKLSRVFFSSEITDRGQGLIDIRTAKRRKTG